MGDPRQIADKIVPPMRGCRVSSECSAEWSKRWQAAHDAAEHAFSTLSTDAEPVASRDDDAGYVEFANEDVPYIVREIKGRVAILTDLETRNVIGYRVYDLIDWPSITNDEFIAEAQRRVTQFSPDNYMSPAQSDDRAKLDILRSRIIVANIQSIWACEDNPRLRELASLCDRLDSISGNPLPKRAYAINTTFVGKTDIEQDHSPK